MDAEHCTACGLCVECCPASALSLEADTPNLDLDRCIGCGVCAAGCPEEAVTLEERPGFGPPAENRKAYR